MLEWTGQIGYYLLTIHMMGWTLAYRIVASRAALLYRVQVSRCPDAAIERKLEESLEGRKGIEIKREGGLTG